MSLSKNITTYNDVRAILDAARTANGARVPFPTPGAAVHWVGRANMFRRLIAERDGSTPWDGFQILRSGNLVEIHPLTIPDITDLEGNPLAPAAAKDADLEAEASVLRRKFGVE